MDPDLDPDTDRLSESSWSRNWEDQVLEEYLSDREALDQQSKLEQDASAQSLWLSFQNSASSVANLYKGLTIEDLTKSCSLLLIIVVSN